MAKQTELGKAFEYACAYAFYERYCSAQPVVLEKSSQLNTAKGFFDNVSIRTRNNLLSAAQAAVRIIERLEPQLKYGERNIPLILSLQSDAHGIAGDVRDVLCIRKQNAWQIGLSCKHNHHAVKHSRLSATIDFGKEWFGKECSPQYFEEVVPIFERLRNLRDRGYKTGNYVMWNEIENKFGDYYYPILTSFMDELKRLDKKYPGEIPKLLINYLIGKFDFYKVITDDAHRTTRIEAVNIAGTLNKPAGGRETIVNVPVLKLPSKFYHIDFKDGSQNTIEVVCDEGWTISMRLHNASSKVEPSLKFDVNLISLPSSIHAQVEPWDSENKSVSYDRLQHQMKAAESGLGFNH